MHAHSTIMSRMVCNALEGLADIQVNNLQQAQLALLDQMIGNNTCSSFSFLSYLLFSHTRSLSLSPLLSAHTLRSSHTSHFPPYLPYTLAT